VVERDVKSLEVVWDGIYTNLSANPDVVKTASSQGFPQMHEEHRDGEL